MNIKEGVLYIDTKIDNNTLSILVEDIRNNIDKIEKVELNSKNGVETSAIFALLYSLKNTNPDIDIPVLNGVNHINGVGFTIIKQG